MLDRRKDLSLSATSTVLSASCHCGSVQISLSERPAFVNDCNCSLCQSTGGIWGYFSTSVVAVHGITSSYTRRDYDEPGVQIHFCDVCGNTTHWTLTEQFLSKNGPIDQMGVNMRLFDTSDLEGVEVRFPDGANWFGGGPYEYRKPSVVIGKDPY
ncbi:MAG: aldehyde-activating protein [Pseudomonadota bacterium]